MSRLVISGEYIVNIADDYVDLEIPYYNCCCGSCFSKPKFMEVDISKKDIISILLKMRLSKNDIDELLAHSVLQE